MILSLGMQWHPLTEDIEISYLSWCGCNISWYIIASLYFLMKDEPKFAVIFLKVHKIL